MGVTGHTKDVGNTCIAFANAQLQMQWVNFTQANNSGLAVVDYAYNNLNILPLGPNTIAICIDLPVLALIHGGWTTPTKSRAFIGAAAKLLATGIGAGLTSWRRGSPPNLGHIVTFNGSAHVAVATGTVNAANDTEVVSFWGSTPASLNGPNLTTVIIDTIENINGTYFGGTANIQEGKPAWRF